MLKLENIAILLSNAGIGVYSPVDDIINTIFLGRVGLNNNKKQEVITLLEQDESIEQPESIGNLTSYEYDAFDIILTWNTSYEASEAKANEIYNFFQTRTFDLADGSKILNLEFKTFKHLGILTNTANHGFKISYNVTKTKI